MKNKATGLTIIESLIGIALIGVVVSGILGVLIIVQSFFLNTVPMGQAQATARILTEKLVRPFRHGKDFNTMDSGDRVGATIFEEREIPLSEQGDYEIVKIIDDDEEILLVKKYIEIRAVSDSESDPVGDYKIQKREKNKEEDDWPAKWQDVSSNIYKTENPVFQELGENEDRIAINFRVRKEGVSGEYRGIEVNTEVQLRN